MFTPIEQFNYDKYYSQIKTPEIFLFQLKTPFLSSTKFAIGHYDEIHDIFKVWYEPGYSDDYKDTKIPITNNTYVILPSKFEQHIGDRTIKSYAKLNNIIKKYDENNQFIHDYRQIPNINISASHILILRTGLILISNIGKFVSGNAFQAVIPTTLRNDTFHLHTAIPSEKIQSFAQIKS